MNIAGAYLCFCVAAGAFAGSKVDESNRYIEKLLSTTFPHYGGVLGYSYLNGFTIKIKMKSVSHNKRGYTSSVTRNAPRHDKPHHELRPDDSPGHVRPDFAQPDFQARNPGYGSSSPPRPYLPQPTPPYRSVWDQFPTTTPWPGNNPVHFRTKRGVVSKVVGGLLAKEMKLHLKEGWLGGLDGMKRLGDCSWPTFQLGHVMLSCYVYLQGFKATYEGYVAGEGLTDSSEERKINVTATLKNARAFIEVTAGPGTKYVSAWALLPYGLKISYSRTIDANSDQRKALQREVEKAVEVDLSDFLYGPLKHGLDNAVKVDSLPMP